MKKRYISLTLIVFIIFYLFISPYIFPLWYSAESIKAIVIDKSTGNPIQDVIVVAYWQFQTGWEGGISGGTIKAMETVTDANGEFYFYEWKNLKPSKNLSGSLGGLSPGILLFKQGYDPWSIQNSDLIGSKLIYIKSRSDWDGRFIELFPKGQSGQNNLAYSIFKSMVGRVAWNNDEFPCIWKDIPIMFFLVHNDLENMTSEHYSKILRHLSGKEPNESCENIDNYLMRIENELQIK